ncbi:hypothetical protein [Rickettsia asembonensis]|uniref:hypothetical protein n=1 Tax=Rickettsia asembonensis TaxID=1068590 RepID=UPI0023F7DE0D|nr:hypothetical protein [Rickettsia asembonensis]WCR56361.1 MAG: hypothetical protein PG979_000418 [Rickettsia asembonensis]
MPEKKHLHFQTEEIELNRVKNAKLIHFKDELGSHIDGQLVIGRVEEVKEKEFSRPVEVEVKRNLGKLKKALAYLGIIKNTKKVIKEEKYTEKVVSKEEKIIGTYELGNFTNDKNSIEEVLRDKELSRELQEGYFFEKICV